jgi:hypothetical protein
MTTNHGAKKLDTGKLPVMRGVFLRFPRAMQEIARVSAVGTAKYGVPIDDMQYKNVEDGEGRYTDALGRHLLEQAINGNESIERGGNLPAEGSEPLRHDAQVAWDALARLEIALEFEARRRKAAEAQGCPNNGDCVGCSDNCVTANEVAAGRRAMYATQARLTGRPNRATKSGRKR